MGNFAGCAAIAYFGTYLCQLFDREPWHSHILAMTEHKVTLGWGVVVLRGIGANWLVCLSIYLGIAASSFEGKLMGLWWPDMAYVTVGYEHSVTNIYYVLTGLMYGSDRTFGDFIARNLIPSTLGNTIAGVFFVSGLLHYVYIYRDPARHSPTGPLHLPPPLPLHHVTNAGLAPIVESRP